MNGTKSQAVATDLGSQKKPSTSNVHPLFTGILRPLQTDVKGFEREDGADLTFDSSKKERWS